MFLGFSLAFLGFAWFVLGFPRISHLNGGPGAVLGRKFCVESEFQDQEPPKSKEIEKIDVKTFKKIQGKIIIFLFSYFFLGFPRISYLNGGPFFPRISYLGFPRIFLGLSYFLFPRIFLGFSSFLFPI